MKLLTRLAALGGVAFNGSSLVIRRGLQRSIHLVPPDSPAAAAGKDGPSWVLLNRHGCRRVADDESMAVVDKKTVAESRTSMGWRRLRVSFRLAAPPASSFLYYDYHGKNIEFAVVAAHGDSIVLRMTRSSTRRRPRPYDHFMYRAGTATRPPSLTLLPEVSIPLTDDHCRDVLLDEDTGVLRRGEGDVLVAQLGLGMFEQDDMAQLCVLHLGTSQSQQWELKRSVPIIHEEGDQLVRWSSGTYTAIPVGDRYLCWVSYRGFILCDMATVKKVSPRLRHVPLPSTPDDPNHYTNDLLPLSDSEGLGAAGPSAVRFVAIEPRCYFRVTTWTLNLSIDEPLKWVKDGVLNCEELWAMPAYEGLPRGHLQSPVVSLDNPNVVCFKVVKVNMDQNTWMIQVDTRRKALLAAVPWTTEKDARRSQVHLPAKL